MGILLLKKVAYVEMVFICLYFIIVDPLRTVGTARRVPHVGNTDDRQTAAAGQHWTGVHRLSSLLSDLRFTDIK